MRGSSGSGTPVAEVASYGLVCHDLAIVCHAGGLLQPCSTHELNHEHPEQYPMAMRWRSVLLVILALGWWCGTASGDETKPGLREEVRLCTCQASCMRLPCAGAPKLDRTRLKAARDDRARGAS